VLFSQIIQTAIVSSVTLFLSGFQFTQLLLILLMLQPHGFFLIVNLLLLLPLLLLQLKHFVLVLLGNACFQSLDVSLLLKQVSLQ
jgi:hypothetical protein